MKTKVIKAILPVAGLGTRLMPLTFHQPKGMAAIADRPMIHYIIDELATAGIRHLILVISPNQYQFKKYTDYLKRDPEWQRLGLQFDFAIQKKLKGNADAVLTAEKFLHDEPFLVYFSDDLLTGDASPTNALIRYYNQTQSPIVILKKIPRRLIESYGIVKAKKVSADFYKISTIVEKPKLKDAPSNMGALGRYILTTDIFPFIRKAEQIFKNKKETAIADVLQLWLESEQKLYGWLFGGHHFDAGSKIGLLRANVYFTFHHPEYKKEFKKFIRRLQHD